MNAATTPRTRRGRGASAPWWVLAIGILLTLLSARRLASTAEEKDSLRFQGLVQKARAALDARMEAHLALLRAGSGLFAAEEAVSREQFRAFVSRIDLRRRYAGIQGIGFSVRVPGDRKDAFLVEQRRQAGPDFRIWPEDHRSECHAIVFLEPLDRRNRAAIGYDMSTEPVRREAMERARRTGVPAASGRVTLVQEIDVEKQAGFLIYMPIFKEAQPTSGPRSGGGTGPELAGFLYSPLRADDLFEGVFGSGLGTEVFLDVYAGSAATPDSLLHRSVRPAESAVAPRFRATEPYELAGFPWTLVLESGPEFERQSGQEQVLVFLLAGLAASVGLLLVTRKQVRARADAERAAAELQRSDEALRRSEEKYRELVELSPHAIGIHADGRFVFVNRVLVKLLGYATAEELLERHLLDVVHPEFHAAVEERLRLLRETGRPNALMEQKLLRADGAVVFVEAASTPFRYNGTCGAQVVFRDITEKRSLECQLRQSQKMEMIGRLAGGVAHDFNNLLTAITGYADILAGRLERDPQLLGYAEEIRKAGERAASLTRQLLAFSRKQILAPKVLELNVVVADMQKMLRRLIGESIELVARLAPDLGNVRADPGQVEQVILNLTVNARDAMPDGGRLLLETGNRSVDDAYAAAHPEARPGPYVFLRVTDTGVGMCAETMAHLFEPFFTTKGVGKGTGLGLSTVYGIVRQSGGHVEVESAPGQGATFCVLLPRVDAAVERPAAEARREVPGGTETVLVVEDEDSVRMLVRETLCQGGYRVVEARSGDEALANLARPEADVDLVIADVVMPGMRGPDLLRRIAEGRPRVKRLLMSGYTGGALDAGDAAGAGATLLPKPFTAKALLRRVRELLDAPAGV
ncbi:MAG: CHASE domain-containing protein [Planctomycetes bacterium]|nr:CHASE domain-containing protein [Planctomycetota bacterium]